MTDPATKTDEEWREELTPEQYEILRRKGTEPPGTGKFTYNKDTGMYRCAGCGTDLFSSDTKYDSGSGWPSFTEPANTTNVELHEDRSHGMVRTEVTCKTCGRTSRARVRRWPGTRRQALLHQLVRARLRADLALR